MCRIRLNELCGQRFSNRWHSWRVVPEMRVFAGLFMDEIGGNDYDTPRLRRCGEQLRHPWVVISTVVNDDLCRRQLTRNSRRDFEQVRVLIGIAQDADHFDSGAADLVSDVPVEILGRYKLDWAVRGARICMPGESEHDSEDNSGEGFHGAQSLGSRLSQYLKM